MKEVKYALKLKLLAKKATPAPPVGPALGPTNINLTRFCDDFNNWSKDLEGEVEIGVLIYNDLSYNILSKKEFKQYEISQMNQSLSFLYNNNGSNFSKKR